MFADNDCEMTVCGSVSYEGLRSTMSIDYTAPTFYAVDKNDYSYAMFVSTSFGMAGIRSHGYGEVRADEILQMKSGSKISGQCRKMNRKKSNQWK